VSARDAALAVAFLNGASALGRIALGRLSDRADAWLLAPLTCAVASVCVFALWGALAPTPATLLALGAVYGLVAGAWFSLWSALLQPIAGGDHALTTTLFGVLLLSTGLGSVLSTPIATALARVPAAPALVGPPASGFAAAGHRFEGMIVYVGVCFSATAAVGMVGWMAQRRR
jgi:MCP family monocarboxylic acid transporter-like MFS transporter 10